MVIVLRPLVIILSLLKQVSIFDDFDFFFELFSFEFIFQAIVDMVL